MGPAAAPRVVIRRRHPPGRSGARAVWSRARAYADGERPAKGPTGIRAGTPAGLTCARDGKAGCMASIPAPPVPLSQVGRAAHDIGLAGLLGGNLFGRLA